MLFPRHCCGCVTLAFQPWLIFHHQLHVRPLFCCCSRFTLARQCSLMSGAPRVLVWFFRQQASVSYPGVSAREFHYPDPETVDRAGLPGVREVSTGDCVHLIDGHAVPCPFPHSPCWWSRPVWRRTLLVLLGSPCTCVLCERFILLFLVCCFGGRAVGVVAIFVLLARLGMFCGSPSACFADHWRVYRRDEKVLYFVMGRRRKEDGCVVTRGLCTS